MELREFVKSYIRKHSPGGGKLEWQSIPCDGSRRSFYRVYNGEHSFVVMANPPDQPGAERENLSYLQIGRHLFSKGVPVPKIFMHDFDRGWFVMEDLGKQNLQELARNNRSYMDTYKKVMELLVKVQVDGREGFNTDWCCQTKRYDRDAMERLESGYFKKYFLKGFMGIEQESPGLEDSFRHLSSRAALAENNFFMYRDFQSRNIIVNHDSIGLVDWQGGRLGPLQYDLASLLIDPYAQLKTRDTRELYDYYLELLEKRFPGISRGFIVYYPYIAVQRNLQILGAFSYLGMVLEKKWFLSFIVPALNSLDGLLKGLQNPELDPLRDLVIGIKVNAIKRP